MFTVKLKLFLLCHVALLRREFIARIFVHVVAFLLMWLLETGDFGNLTTFKSNLWGLVKYVNYVEAARACLAMTQDKFS